uniref:Pecanex-like protein n=1 Tax=Panagrellus redivivus TaxID=6233 RepID=A0A7E4VL65_PANRE
MMVLPSIMSEEVSQEASSSATDHEDLELPYPCPSPVTELSFSSQRDLDVPLSETLNESSSPPKRTGIIRVVTKKMFKIGMQFHHASGKRFIVCNDGVIREVVQDPSPSATEASGSVEADAGADSGHVFKSIQFKPTAKVASISENGVGSSAGTA